MSGLTVDSCFVIDLIRGADPAHREVAQRVSRLSARRVMTTPVLYELYSGVELARSKSEAAKVRAAVTAFEVMALDEPAAQRAAEIRAEFMRIGRPKSAVDLMIAGIASVYGLTLVTRDADLVEVASVVGFDVVPYGPAAG